MVTIAGERYRDAVSYSDSHITSTALVTQFLQLIGEPIGIPTQSSFPHIKTRRSVQEVNEQYDENSFDFAHQRKRRPVKGRLFDPITVRLNYFDFIAPQRVASVEPTPGAANPLPSRSRSMNIAQLGQSSKSVPSAHAVSVGAGSGCSARGSHSSGSVETNSSTMPDIS